MTKAPYTYEYPRPALTADVIALCWRAGRLEVAVIERGSPPFKGQFALPGGFVDEQEAPQESAARELKEEVGIDVSSEELIEIGIFGDPGRDPRGWNVSTVFIALVPKDSQLQAGDDAAQVHWIPWEDLQGKSLPLAFDHQSMIDRSSTILRRISLTEPTLLKLLGPQFRVRHARHLYNQIWTTHIPPRRFKAWLRKQDAVERAGKSIYQLKKGFKRPW